MHKKALFLLLVCFLISCNKKENPIQISIDRQVVEHDVYARNLSLTEAEKGVVCTYGDEVTLSLKQTEIGDTVNVSYIDNIDLESRLNPVFGRHYYFKGSGGDDLFYYDYQKKDKRIFKYLTRTKKDDLYSVLPLPIDCINFSITGMGEKYLVLYKNKQIQIGIIENKTFKKAQVNNFDYPRSDIRLIRAEDKLYLVFLDKNNSLCWSEIKGEGPESFTITYPTLIDKKVKLYDVKARGDRLTLLYYKDDYSLNYYEGTTKQIGYFAELSDLHLLHYKEKPFFLYISFEEKEEPGEALYNLYACYESSGDVWAEEPLYTSQTVLFSLDSITDNNTAKIVVGGSSILLFTLHITDNTEKKTQVTVDIAPIIRYKHTNAAG